MKKGKKRTKETGYSGNGPSEKFVNRMVELFNRGEFQSFEEKARQAVERWPRHPFGWKALGNLYFMQGKPDDALKPYLRCVELNRDDFQVLNNLGSVFLELRQLEEAEKKFLQALALNPDYAHAYTNLGLTYLRQGRFDDALKNYRKALALQPDFAQAHNNLGNALMELGQIEKAEASFRKAVEINPELAEAHCNLGDVLIDRGRLGEAKTSYQQALALRPDYPKAQSGLGDVLFRRGRFRDSINHYQKCIQLDPLWIKAHDGLNKARGQLVPLWHVPMMNDTLRNAAYHDALKNAVTPETNVLEIGTGSGLLAMMAAKIGAKHVTTCEGVEDIAETAQKIVADNGYSDKVTVIPKLSTKLEVGKDLAEPADILVSEILSSEFLGEGVLSSMEDAKRRLLKPGARIIPARGSIQVALFGGTDIEKNIRVDEVHGFDLSGFNNIVAQKQYISRDDLEIELLSDDTCAFFFDFVGTDRFARDERKTLEIPVRKPGKCCGIIQWLRLEMDDTIVFENHPAIKSTASGWQKCVYTFPSPVNVSPGQTVVISAAHTRNTPWFMYDGLKQ
jgi:tetratricopeptide (TPR) repeat protein